MGFQIASYDPKQPFIIDPVLSYSTYLGGSNDDLPSGIAVDSAGNAYVTGFTLSPDFPTTPGAFDRTCGSDGRCNPNGSFLPPDDMFVTKLNATGTALIYSTYLGGGDDDKSRDIALDSAGNAYVTGSTLSTDFPTVNPFQTAQGREDAFVTKLNATGTGLVYSTYLGGSGFFGDGAGGIAVDSTGSAYVAGGTTSPDFPTTVGAFDRSLSGTSDAFITKLTPTGNALVYSTLLGGSGDEGSIAIALDSVGNA